MIYRWFSQYAKAFVQGFVIGLPVCITFVDNVGSVARVHGSSMQPTLNPDPRSTGDVVVLSRWAIRNFRGINKGDIVSVVDPTDPNIVLIKRVVAMEGDCVRTLKNNNKLVTVPRGHCWVEGDNHSHSLDSNTFGPVAVGLVQSKATYIVWPPERWSRIENYLPQDRKPVNPHHKLAELEDDDEYEVIVEVESKPKAATAVKHDVSESAIFPDKFGPIS